MAPPLQEAVTTTSYLAPLGKPRSSFHLRKYVSRLTSGGLRPTSTQTSGEQRSQKPCNDEEVSSRGGRKAATSEDG